MVYSVYLPGRIKDDLSIHIFCVYCVVYALCKTSRFFLTFIYFVFIENTESEIAEFMRNIHTWILDTQDTMLCYVIKIVCLKDCGRGVGEVISSMRRGMFST